MNLFDELERLLNAAETKKDVASYKDAVRFWNTHKNELAQIDRPKASIRQARLQKCYDNLVQEKTDQLPMIYDSLKHALMAVRDRETLLQAKELFTSNAVKLVGKNAPEQARFLYAYDVAELRKDLNRMISAYNENGEILTYRQLKEEDKKKKKELEDKINEKNARSKAMKGIFKLVASAGLIAACLASCELQKKGTITPTVERNYENDDIIEVSNDQAVIDTLADLLNTGGPHGLEVSNEQIFDAWLLANYESVLENSTEQNKEYRERLNYLSATGKELSGNFLKTVENMASSKIFAMKNEGKIINFSSIFNATQSRYEIATTYEELVNNLLTAIQNNDEKAFESTKATYVEMLQKRFAGTSAEKDSVLDLFLLQQLNVVHNYAYNHGYTLLSDTEVEAFINNHLAECQSSLGTVKDSVDAAYGQNPADDLADILTTEGKLVEGKKTRNDIVSEIEKKLNKSTYKTRMEASGEELEKIPEPTPGYGYNTGGSYTGNSGGTSTGSGSGSSNQTTTTEEIIDKNAPTNEVIDSEIQDAPIHPDTPLGEEDDYGNDYIDIITRPGHETENPRYDIYDPEEDKPDVEPGDIKEETWYNSQYDKEFGSESAMNLYVQAKYELADSESFYSSVEGIITNANDKSDFSNAISHLRRELDRVDRYDYLERSDLSEVRDAYNNLSSIKQMIIGRINNGYYNSQSIDNSNNANNGNNSENGNANNSGNDGNIIDSEIEEIPGLGDGTISQTTSQSVSNEEVALDSASAKQSLEVAKQILEEAKQQTPTLEDAVVLEEGPKL